MRWTQRAELDLALGVRALGVLFYAGWWLFAVTTVHAECVTITAKHVMSESGIVLAFEGHVVNTVQINQRVSRRTFEVVRVWKGSAPTRVDLYVSDLNAEAPVFREHGESVVLAYKFKDAELRKAAGLSDSEAPTELEAMGCTDAYEPNIAEKLGTGYPATGR
jgi:hypothetical protein